METADAKRAPARDQMATTAKRYDEQEQQLRQQLTGLQGQRRLAAAYTPEVRAAKLREIESEERQLRMDLRILKIDRNDLAECRAAVGG